MGLFVLRAAHFLHEIFSEQLGGVRWQSGEAERDDVRGEKVSAKNVAQKLTRGFGSRASRHEPLVFIGVAKLPRCAVEGPNDVLGGNHLCLQWGRDGKNAR